MTALEKLLESGSIIAWCGEYIGTASDGVEVILGEIGREDTLESYLLSHPTPETW